MAAPKSVLASLAQLRDRRWSEPDARVVLDALDRSGDSISSFARQHGLDPQRIYKWRSRLADGKHERTNRAEEIAFAPVVVTGLGRGTAAVVIRVGEIELEIVEPNRVDPSWVAQMIAATRSA